jgi:hypothetical protein
VDSAIGIVSAQFEESCPIWPDAEAVSSPSDLSDGLELLQDHVTPPNSPFIDEFTCDSIDPISEDLLRFNEQRFTGLHENPCHGDRATSGSAIENFQAVKAKIRIDLYFSRAILDRSADRDPEEIDPSIRGHRQTSFIFGDLADASRATFFR